MVRDEGQIEEGQLGAGVAVDFVNHMVVVHDASAPCGAQVGPVADEVRHAQLDTGGVVVVHAIRVDEVVARPEGPRTLVVETQRCYSRHAVAHHRRPAPVEPLSGSGVVESQRQPPLLAHPLRTVQVVHVAERWCHPDGAHAQGVVLQRHVVGLQRGVLDEEAVVADTRQVRDQRIAQRDIGSHQPEHRPVQRAVDHRQLCLVNDEVEAHCAEVGGGGVEQRQPTAGIDTNLMGRVDDRAVEGEVDILQGQRAVDDQVAADGDVFAEAVDGSVIALDSPVGVALAFGSGEQQTEGRQRQQAAQQGPAHAHR